MEVWLRWRVGWGEEGGVEDGGVEVKRAAGRGMVGVERGGGGGRGGGLGAGFAAGVPN